MKAIKCEMCGSNDIIKRDGYYVCENCGTKYTPDEARKLMDTIDNSEKVKNLYILARRARDSENYADGQKYYSEILVEEPDSWEATFYNVYFRALQCKIGQIGQAASSISNCLKDVFVLIRDKVDPEMRHEECMQVLAQVSNAAVMLFGAAADHYNKHYEVDGTKQDFLDWANAILVMLFECGKNLDHIVNEWELSEEAYKFGKNLAKATGPQNF